MKSAALRAISITLIAVAATTSAFAQPEQTALTPQQKWAEEGRYWAVEQLCNGEEGLQAARRSTSMTALSLSGAKHERAQGEAIAERELMKTVRAVKQDRAQVMCQELQEDLSALIASRAEGRMLGEEAGRQIKAYKQVSAEVFDRLVQTVERGQALMARIMEAASRASS